MVYGITRNGKFRTYVAAHNARDALDDYISANNYAIYMSSSSYFEVENIKRGRVFEYTVEPVPGFDVTMEGSHAAVV